GNHRGGVTRELRGRVFVGRIGDVDQVMRDAAPLVERHLVGGGVATAINRGRVAVDDLAVEALGERNAEGAFARGGGTKNRNQGRHNRFGTPGTPGTEAPWLYCPGGDSL